MKGRIVTFAEDRHALQLLILGGNVWESGINGVRYWKTIDDVERYAQKNGIDIIQKCWMA